MTPQRLLPALSSFFLSLLALLPSPVPVSPALALSLPSSCHHASVVVSVAAASLLSPAHALWTRLLHPSRGINSPPPTPRSSSSRHTQGTALVLGHALETCPLTPPSPGLSSQLPSPTCSLYGPLYGSLSGPVLSDPW